MSVQIQPISDTVDIHSLYIRLSYVSKRACAIRKAFAQHITRTIWVTALSHGHNAITWSKRYHMVTTLSHGHNAITWLQRFHMVTTLYVVTTLSRGHHAIFLSKSNEHT